MPFDVPDQGCDHTHGIKSAERGIQFVMRDPRPLTKERGAKNWHYVNCTRSRTARAKVRRKLIAMQDWRQGHKWLLAWETLSPGERAWANSTAWCETGGTMNPQIHNPGGQYHGLMQFDLRTWGEAGGSGDPHNASANEQKVRAVYLMHRVGTGRWPNCG